MSETHLIPRKVTTRFEFVPGFGGREATAMVAGLAVSVLLYRILSLLHVPAPVGLFLSAVPPVLAVVLFLGDQESLYVRLRRAQAYGVATQRFLYRTGSVGSSPESGPARPGSLGLGALAALLKPRGNRPTQRSTGNSAVQNWLPVRDVAAGVIHRSDGGLVVAVQITPINLALKSAAEQARLIGALHEAVNGLGQPAQILALPRPLDLDAYVRNLEARLRDLDPSRQRLLRHYIRYVNGLVAGGEAHERRFYVLLPQVGATAAEELHQRAHDFAARLRSGDLNVHILSNQELLDLLHVWSHPAQASFERPPGGLPAITTFPEV